MGVNITTIAYLRVLIIEIGSTIILMVVEAQGNGIMPLRQNLLDLGQIQPCKMGPEPIVINAGT